MEYRKGPLKFADQLALLQQRGLQVDDPQLATLYLQRVGYYRLMGYLFPMRLQGSDEYHPGSMFQSAVDRYNFDHQLRALVLDAVCHIEVAVRTAVTYEMAHAYGAFAHAKANSFAYDQAWHADWLATIETEIDRARETFIDHYKAKYDGYPRLPIWMATEVMSLGSISKMYKGMHPANQKAVATRFGVAHTVLSSWLHSVSVVRNICAHHGRLWNRVLGVSPALPKSGAWQYLPQLTPNNRVFFALMVIRMLLVNSMMDANEWRDRISDLLRPFLADPASQASMGAPQNWEQHPAWR